MGQIGRLGLTYIHDLHIVKVHIVKPMVFPVVMYVSENWTIRQSTKELMLSTVVLEKTPESPLDCKEIKPVNLKRNQP